MVTLTVKVPEILLKTIDKYVELGEFDCRSELIRMAIRSYLVEIKRRKTAIPQQYPLLSR